ncbi:hypothetical protein N665_0347s0023 [Sinapis alba]|nr:hypothetical protein N665_0347s0023 [Sinapis alba]
MMRVVVETETVVETTKVDAETVVETTEIEAEIVVETETVVEAKDDALEESPTEKKAEEETGEVTATPEEGEKYTEAKKQRWHMVVYKGSEEMPCESKKLAKMRKAKGKKKAKSDGTPKKRGRPKKGETDGTPKKRGRPKKEAITLVACTPREKKKIQWLQSPFMDVKTEDIEGPSKKRKTKA